MANTKFETEMLTIFEQAKDTGFLECINEIKITINDLADVNGKVEVSFLNAILDSKIILLKSKHAMA